MLYAAWLAELPHGYGYDKALIADYLDFKAYGEIFNEKSGKYEFVIPAGASRLVSYPKASSSGY